MAQVDASLISAPPPTVALQSPMDAAQKVLTFKDLMLRNQQQQQAVQLQDQQVRDQQTLASLYRQHTNADGTLDTPAIVQGLGQQGSGHLIPGFQTQQQAIAKSQADVASTQVTTQDKSFDLLKKKLDASSATIGSLLSDPNVTQDKVAHSLVQQVQSGMLDQAHAENTFQAMPQPTGDPVADRTALRTWLQQQNLRIADAQTRLAQVTQKPTAMNNGKTTMMVDQNPVTNPGIVGSTMQMQTTPGEDLTAQTTRRGQDLNFDTQNNQVEPTPTGYVVVNKHTNTGNTVMAPNGVQVMQPASPVYKNEQTYQSMVETANAAHQILTRGQPTASGFGKMADSSAAFFGVGTNGAQDAARLEALGGALTASIPRMEGPQSDADRKAYESQAGKVGDSSQPLSTRIAALETVMALQKRYAKFNGGNGVTPQGQPQGSVVPTINPGGLAPTVPGNRPPLNAFNR